MVVPLADDLIVTTTALRDLYGGHLIPCGVDDTRFRPGPPRRPGDRIRAHTVGEDRPEKQFWLASRAAAHASRRGIEFDHRFVTGVHPDRMPEIYRSAQ